MKKLLSILLTIFMITVLMTGCKSNDSSYDTNDYQHYGTEDKSTLNNGLDETWTEESTIKSSMFSDLNVGDTIKFGKYEQDNDKSNGAEEIEWVVLQVDFGRALVISKDCIESQAFDEDCFNEWEGSTLRKWMNDTFYNTAFSSKEQNYIELSDINNPGNDLYDVYDKRNTSDKIFALSMDEANQYFTDDVQRQVVPTAYAKSQGVKTEENGNCYWWLRTTGSHNSMKNFSTCVTDEGWISDFGESAGFSKIGVRPAMWIITE